MPTRMNRPHARANPAPTFGGLCSLMTDTPVDDGLWPLAAG